MFVTSVLVLAVISFLWAFWSLWHLLHEKPREVSDVEKQLKKGKVVFHHEASSSER